MEKSPQDLNAFDPHVERRITEAMEEIEQKIAELQKHLAAFKEADAFNRRNFAVLANRIWLEARRAYDDACEAAR